MPWFASESGEQCQGHGILRHGPLDCKIAGSDVDFPVPGPHVRLKVCACHVFQPEAWTYLER